MNLDGASIDAEVRLRDVRVDSGSLAARGVVVAGNLEYVNVQEPLAAPRLSGAKIGGSLTLAGRIGDPTSGMIAGIGGANVGDDARTTGSPLHGGVDLRGVHIGGDLSMQGAEVRDAEAVVDAHGIEVRGDVRLSRGFQCAGTIDLSGAMVGRAVNLDDALLDVRSCRVKLDWSEIREYLTIHPRTGPAHLSLWHTTVGAFYDDASTWPRTLRLDGFDFTAIQARPPISPDRRLEWVHLHRADASVDVYRYTPEIYERLAAAYTRGGYRDAARTIGIAKQWDRVVAPARAAPRSMIRRYSKCAGSYFLRATVGYGYRPWRIAWIVGALLAVGQVLFSYAYEVGAIMPEDAGQATEFSAVRYSFDSLVPIVDQGVRDAYVASGFAAWLDFAYSILGWLIAAVLAAGLSGVLKRD